MTDILAPYSEFLQTFRNRYVPDDQTGQTPAQRRRNLPDGRVATLPAGLTWSPGKSLPLVSGRVHCLRETDSHSRLDVLGRIFTLDGTYRRSYIRATLTVAEQQVAFYYQPTAEQAPDLIGTQPFPLQGPAEPWNASLYLRYLT